MPNMSIVIFNHDGLKPSSAEVIKYAIVKSITKLINIDIISSITI